jgi:hypothetical protein
MGQVTWMINLDKQIGPWPLRVWGLVLNFIGNAITIYGAIGFTKNGSRLLLLIFGVVFTLTCLLVLAKPGE